MLNLVAFLLFLVDPKGQPVDGVLIAWAPDAVTCEAISKQYLAEHAESVAAVQAKGLKVEARCVPVLAPYTGAVSKL